MPTQKIHNSGFVALCFNRFGDLVRIADKFHSKLVHFVPRLIKKFILHLIKRFIIFYTNKSRDSPTGRTMAFRAIFPIKQSDT